MKYGIQSKFSVLFVSNQRAFAVNLAQHLISFNSIKENQEEILGARCCYARSDKKKLNQSEESLLTELPWKVHVE